MPERLAKASHRAVGTRQTLRALEDGTAQVVFIAGDAEPRVIKPVEELCRRRGAVLVRINNMQELGKYCSIDVGAAAAAVVSGRSTR